MLSRANEHHKGDADVTSGKVQTLGPPLVYVSGTFFPQLSLRIMELFHIVINIITVKMYKGIEIKYQIRQLLTTDDQYIVTVMNLSIIILFPSRS